MWIGGQVVIEPAYNAGESYPQAVEDLAGDADGPAPHGESLALVSEDGFGECTEIAQHVIPLGLDPGLLHPAEQIPLEHECEEGAEDVAADGGIGAVEDGTGLEQVLGVAEEPLDAARGSRKTPS